MLRVVLWLAFVAISLCTDSAQETLVDNLSELWDGLESGDAALSAMVLLTDNSDPGTAVRQQFAAAAQLALKAAVAAEKPGAAVT